MVIKTITQPATENMDWAFGSFKFRPVYLIIIINFLLAIKKIYSFYTFVLPNDVCSFNYRIKFFIKYI